MPAPHRERSSLLVAALLFACAGQSTTDGEAVKATPPPAPAADPRPAVTTVDPTPVAPEDGPVRARAEFAAALARIKPGTAEAEVRRSLGAPDDVRTERDPGGIRAARTVEVWRYGTNGHLTFGTLGTLHMQADRTVQYVFGGSKPVAVGVGEAELRRLMRLLAAVPSYNDRLDPLRLIQAVNALQRHGKAEALAVIEEFLRVASWLDDPGREGVFLVLRALFDPPAGMGLPVMMVGGPSPAPADLSALPRHPLVIVDDIPLSVVRGYMLGGHAQDPADHIPWFRDHGVLRAAPLRPSDTPLAAVERAFGPGGSLARAAGLDADDGRALVYDQALALLDTVYRPASDVYGLRFSPGPDVARRWQAVRAEVESLGATWDAARDVYAMPGGRTLPARPRATRPRALWDLAIPGAKTARLTLELRDEKFLEVEARIEIAAGQTSAQATIRLVDAGSGANVAQVELQPVSAPVNSTAGSATSTRVPASPGVRLRAELIVDGKVSAQTELAP